MPVGVLPGQTSGRQGLLVPPVGEQGVLCLHDDSRLDAPSTFSLFFVINNIYTHNIIKKTSTSFRKFFSLNYITVAL